MGRIAPRLIVCLTVANSIVAAQTHPLEPLTRAELTRAVQITRADSRFTVGSRFNIIRLAEPPPSRHPRLKPGQSSPPRVSAGPPSGETPGHPAHWRPGRPTTSHGPLLYTG